MDSQQGQLVSYSPRQAQDIYAFGDAGDLTKTVDVDGIKYEREGTAARPRRDLYMDILTKEERDVIRSMNAPTFKLSAPSRLVNNPNTSTQLEGMYDLVAIRARRRFSGDQLFPSELLGMTTADLEVVASFCAVKGDSEKFPIPTIAVRMALVLSGVLVSEDYKPSTEATVPEDLTDIFTTYADIKEEEYVEYLAAVGVSILVCGVAKPFVGVVPSSLRVMVKNLRKDLRIKEEHLSESIYGSLFEEYFRKVDMRVIARTIANRKFRGAQWLTTYASRYGAGTSHLVAIASFINRFPDCPMWGYVPSIELVNFQDAMTKVAGDPLALYPVGDAVEEDLDRFRVKGMPSILVLALLTLKYSGDVNWARYQNMPDIHGFGSLTTEMFARSLLAWINIKRSPEGIAQTILAGELIDEVIDDFESLPVSKFVQYGGKKVTTLGREAAIVPLV